MTPRRRRPAALVAALVAALALVGAACSSDEDGAATTTTADDGHGHGEGSSQFGSSMQPDVVSVAELAELGPGPEVGDEWSGWIGLDVCGRFLEPPTPVAPAPGAVSTTGDGSYSVAPTSEAHAGHAATIGGLAEQVGIGLSTGELTLPDTVEPASFDLEGAMVQAAGATFRTGETCGGTPAEVQLWVYSRDAADSGEDVRVIVTDPQDAPVVEDGMAFVIAFAPESSLPTLPPSALVDPPTA